MLSNGKAKMSYIPEPEKNQGSRRKLNKNEDGAGDSVKVENNTEEKPQEINLMSIWTLLNSVKHEQSSTKESLEENLKILYETKSEVKKLNELDLAKMIENTQENTKRIEVLEYEVKNNDKETAETIKKMEEKNMELEDEVRTLKENEEKRRKNLK